MSFQENTYQQMSFTDSFSGLTAREQKALENSWAKVFADEIFPAIDEQRFSVLYSDKASRPNTPVNVVVGALIIKELFDYSDDEMVENLMLDFRIQYALHTTSFEEQPLSDKTLSRFRKRCYDYETLHNKDLYHDCVKDRIQHPQTQPDGADIYLYLKAGSACGLNTGSVSMIRLATEQAALV